MAGAGLGAGGGGGSTVVRGEWYAFGYHSPINVVFSLVTVAARPPSISGVFTAACVASVRAR